MAALPSLELQCFGAPTASVGGGPPPPDVLWKKHLGLLIYLALSPNFRRSREHLMGVFWPESTQDKARKSLNNAVFKLRGSLGEARLPDDGPALVLNADGVTVDALRFLATADRSPQDAVRLVSGVFLEGFHVDEAPEFEDWMAVERRRFDSLGATVRVKAGERELNQARFMAAIEHARRALETEPHSEPAIKLLMRALALSDDTAGAMVEYHTFTDRLGRDVHEQASKTLAEFAERIRTRAIRPKRPDAPVEPPLVGRASVHNDVMSTLTEGLTHGARTIVITADPGMGRTRLAAYCAERAAIDGALIVTAHPLESDHDARWSTLRQLLRTTILDAPGLPAAPPLALATLAGLVPDWASRFTPRESHDVTDVATALGATLRAIAEETPVMLAIDDAHCADGATLAALHAAFAQLTDARAVLVVTQATGVGTPAVELQQLEAAVTRSLPGVVARLDPLTDDELGVLVKTLATWCQDDDRRGGLTRRLAHETGGSPLFAITLLRALERATTLRADLTSWPPKGHTSLAPLPFSVPSVVRHAVELRVGELSKEERAVVAAASIAGLGLDLDLVAALVDRSRDDVERALPALERRALVAFDGSRYAFLAPLVAKAIRDSCLTPGERRRLERKAVDFLADRNELEQRVLRGELWIRIERSPKSLAFVEEALRDAVSGGATRLARRARVALEGPQAPA